MPTLLQTQLSTDEQAFIDKLVADSKGRPGALLTILEAAQERNPHNYLPLETLRYIAAKTATPLARIYSVATFYSLFNLQPQGENTICICRGTACHTRGSRNLLQGVRLDLGLAMETEESDGTESDKMVLTTEDGKFTVRTVACFGQCAMAPVVEVNHHICGHATERTVQREIGTIRGGE
ncbi:MAG: NAD(P)H-dependent oxidoreductase subunit E [Terriglobales bacterium]|jgi:NADH-quinone oxidoreductase subunit E